METEKHRPVLAFLFAVPIAILGGLIGLGGAEFRLPVLAGPLRYSVKQAVPLNLLISLITVATSLAIRSRTISLAALQPLIVPILALICGAVIAAFFGVAFASAVSEKRLEQIISMLLTVIGIALIVEAFLPETGRGLIPRNIASFFIAGMVFGLAIGLVSSLLGVAGGEMIIPTLIFGYGAGVKLAGTASLFISLPTILVGLFRYRRRGAFTDRVHLVQTVLPMGLGSVIGALLGGLLAGIVPASVLKFILGAILIVSAVRIFWKSRSAPAA